MKFESKFNFNQIVIPISRESKQIFYACGFCSGTGKITGADGSKQRCPEWCDYGTKSKWEPQKWLIPTRHPTLRIGQVRIELNHARAKRNDQRQYMCFETGIGSGSCWLEENLFANIEEAELECTKRNAEELAKNGKIS